MLKAQLKYSQEPEWVPRHLDEIYINWRGSQVNICLCKANIPGESASIEKGFGQLNRKTKTKT